MLLAGGGADYFSSDGGAFMFALGNSPSSEWWADGSAICSLLVRALTALLSGVVLWRLVCSLLRLGRTGTTVPRFLANIRLDGYSRPGGFAA